MICVFFTLCYTRKAFENKCPGSSVVEQKIENLRVGGSIPPLGTILRSKELRMAQPF